MSRRKRVPKPLIDQIRDGIGLTSIIVVGVGQYDELRDLGGVGHDLESINEIFSSNGEIALYSESEMTILENPSSAKFRSEILSYAVDRSARGDILLLYYSGHGAVLRDGKFAFCLNDTRLGYEGNGVLPVSVVTFNEVVNTLASVDVHPIFIIDACFSGLTAPQGYSQIEGSMQSEVQSIAPGSYALLASASPVSVSIDTPAGGGFTQALHNVVLEGLSDEEGKQFPILSLDQLMPPLQDELSKQGHPLPKIHIGQYLPPFAFSRNSKFSPDNESFTPYMKGIVTYLWNDGSPIEIAISDIGKDLGPTEYANHRKLSLPPWQLLEDGSGPKTRRLARRGERFANGEITIPKRLIRDPLSWEWVPDPNTSRIRISDI